VAAELVNTRPDAPLTAVLDELNDERRRLDLLSDPADSRTAVGDVFSWSLRHVPPATQHVFALLGSLPVTRFEPYAVGAAAGVTPELARTSLSTLANKGLLQAAGSTSWTFHDLLRAYARDLPAPTSRRGALARLADFYLVAAAAASDVCYRRTVSCGRRHHGESTGKEHPMKIAMLAAATAVAATTLLSFPAAASAAPSTGAAAAAPRDGYLYAWTGPNRSGTRCRWFGNAPSWGACTNRVGSVENRGSPADTTTRTCSGVRATAVPGHASATEPCG
jgi:hypothetical protein